MNPVTVGANASPRYPPKFWMEPKDAVQWAGAATEARAQDMPLAPPAIVAYGTCETPEFQRQNHEFAAAVETAGKKVRLLVGEHCNHFELPETLCNPYGLLGRAALDLIGLPAGVCP
jgi:hypothetical protein